MPLYRGGQRIAKLYRGAMPIARAYQGAVKVFGTAFLPTDIANLQLWLDAADIATITDAGSGAVSAWADKSGLGRDFSQATAGARPTTGVNSLNGKNVLFFNQDWIVSDDAAATWSFLHQAGGSSVFLVFRTTAAVSQRMDWFGNTVGSDKHGYSFRTLTDGGNYHDHRAVRGVLGAGNQTFLNTTANDVNVPGTFSIISVLSDPGNATAADRSEIRKNGGTAIKNNSITNAPSSADASFTIAVGRLFDSTDVNRMLRGDVAEVIVYSGVVSSPNRAAVEAYLSAKWGIALA